MVIFNVCGRQLYGRCPQCGHNVLIALRARPSLRSRENYPSNCPKCGLSTKSRSHVRSSHRKSDDSARFWTQAKSRARDWAMSSIPGGRLAPLSVASVLILWLAAYHTWTSFRKFDEMLANGTNRPDTEHLHAVNNHGFVRYATEEEYFSYQRFQVGGIVGGSVAVALWFYADRRHRRMRKR